MFWNYNIITSFFFPILSSIAPIYIPYPTISQIHDLLFSNWRYIDTDIGKNIYIGIENHKYYIKPAQYP